MAAQLNHTIVWSSDQTISSVPGRDGGNLKAPALWGACSSCDTFDFENTGIDQG